MGREVHLQFGGTLSVVPRRAESIAFVCFRRTTVGAVVRWFSWF